MLCWTWQMALLFPDFSQLRFTISKKKLIIYENETFFSQDKFCLLMGCLRLMEPIYEPCLRPQASFDYDQNLFKIGPNSLRNSFLWHLRRMSPSRPFIQNHVAKKFENFFVEESGNSVPTKSGVSSKIGSQHILRFYFYANFWGSGNTLFFKRTPPLATKQWNKF